MTSSFQTERPWGMFETLYDADTYKVKKYTSIQTSPSLFNITIIDVRIGLL